MMNVKNICYALLLSVLPFFAWGQTSDRRGEEIVKCVAQYFAQMKSYVVEFEVEMEEGNVKGGYGVEGENYLLQIGGNEVLCDGVHRYEVNHENKEVVIVKIEKESHNLLDDPVHAFDFLEQDYSTEVVEDTPQKITIRLTPTKEKLKEEGIITLGLSTSYEPREVVYDFDGEQIRIVIQSVKPMEGILRKFDKKDYENYEMIDFR